MGSEIVYGPYKKGSNPDRSTVTIIVEHPEPLLVIEKVVREVTVSSWNDIEVEEHYHIRNVGPTFKDGFSRVEYSRNPKAYIANDFSLVLPKEAHSLFFIDVLGNITTSNARFEHEKVTVEAVPRFPLVGGWQTHFTFGYKLPKYSFIRTEPKTGSKVLSMDILPAVQGIHINNLTISAAVPEFSTKVGGGALASTVLFTELDPFRLVKTSSGVKKHFFDLFGRPVHTLEMSDISPELSQVAFEFYVKYSFNDILKWKEPSMILAMIGVFAAVSFTWSISDFTLVKKGKKVKTT